MKEMENKTTIAPGSTVWIENGIWHTCVEIRLSESARLTLTHTFNYEPYAHEWRYNLIDLLQQADVKVEIRGERDGTD